MSIDRAVVIPVVIAGACLIDLARWHASTCTVTASGIMGVTLVAVTLAGALALLLERLDRGPAPKVRGTIAASFVGQGRLQIGKGRENVE